MSILELHPDKVSPEPNSGCWLWTAALSKAGYGVVGFKKKICYAHRVSYTLSCEEIPEKTHILHKCDTPACVNPSHLFSGTSADNMADKVSKGRQTRGEGIGVSSLSEAQVLEIRSRLEEVDPTTQKPISQKCLAKEYGVDQSLISYIRNRKIWKHI